MKHLPILITAAVLALDPMTGVSDSTAPMAASAWADAPVLDNGRVKPLDSYARDMLLSFSGKSTYNREPAIDWLTRVFFDPGSTADDEVFLINNPEVAEALNIRAKGRDRYSFNKIRTAMAELSRLARAAMSTPREKRFPFEQEVIRLFHTVNTYQQLGRSLDFAVPREEFRITSTELRKNLGLPAEGALSFLDMKIRQPLILKLLARQANLPKDGLTMYQRELKRVGLLTRMWSNQRGSLPPSMIPVNKGEERQWLRPWDILSMPQATASFTQEFTALSDMARAYVSGDQDGFNETAHRYVTAVNGRLDGPGQPAKLGFEVSYNKSKAFYRSEMLYGLAFIISLFAVAFRSRWTYRTAFALAAMALLPHTYGIVCRMIIMGRPPVTNLYSTFIFVGWCCALIGLAAEHFQKNRLGLITASSMGLALLLTARRFGTDGDTMGVMVAVLDSNFWLATHVVTISMGYAGCVASGVLGHIYLLQALRKAPDDPGLRQTFRAVYGAQAFGLIFSFVGTMLGGVWADQSWGRFWGWDPKENGALVIVLWSAILFHARLAKMMGPRGFAAGSVLGIIWVLLAWLGVNLLNVGLHSYGFTSGIARGLALACGLEVLFVMLTVPFSKRKRSSPGAIEPSSG